MSVNNRQEEPAVRDLNYSTDMVPEVHDRTKFVLHYSCKVGCVGFCLPYNKTILLLRIFLHGTSTIFRKTVLYTQASAELRFLIN